MYYENMKNLIKKFTTAAVIIGSTLFASTLFVMAAAWQGPSAAPTGNNTDTPINVGNRLQGKKGGLDIGGAPYSAAEGILLSRGTFETRGSAFLATLGGIVWVGTTGKPANLTVVGTLENRSSAFLATLGGNVG